MISAQNKETILALHKAETGIRQISRLMNISRNTVRRVIKGEHSSKIDRATRYEYLLPLVREHFRFCKGNVLRIKEYLNETYGHDIPYSTLTRLVREMELKESKKKRRAGEYHFDPGKETQHDTSPHRLKIGNKKLTAQCASLTMGYCRRVFIQYYPRFTRFEAKVFLTEAFVYMAGICERCIIDNTSVIVAQGSGPDAIIAPEMEIFGKIFDTEFIPHELGDADRKAKVERNFRYVENNFLAGRTFADWQDLNAQARAWCNHKANKKPKRSLNLMSPDAVYIMEKPHLKALPSHIPPVYQTLQRIVDMSGFVTVDTNRYSAPEKLCKEHVEVLKSYIHITIYHKNRKVAVHERLIDKRDAKVTLPCHHMPFYKKKNEKRVLKEEGILMGCSKALDRYVVRIKKSCYGSGRRKLQKLLELQRTYPADAFEKAVDSALHYGLYDLARLENMILSFVAGDFFNLKADD
ncbi:MAG: IS21 family transposase [Deltaproteobacteria bacterium]|nr:IS21 family transposase [Deltaproteobacteria bacterium]